MTGNRRNACHFFCPQRKTFSSFAILYLVISFFLVPAFVFAGDLGGGLPGDDLPDGGSVPDGSHNICAGIACVSVPGAGIDQCQSNADCEPPDDDGVVEYTKCVQDRSTGIGYCGLFTHDTTTGVLPPDSTCLDNEDCNDWVCSSLDNGDQAISKPNPGPLGPAGGTAPRSASLGQCPGPDCLTSDLGRGSGLDTGPQLCRPVFGTGKRYCQVDAECTHTECALNPVNGDPYCKLILEPGDDECVQTDFDPNKTGPVMLDLPYNRDSDESFPFFNEVFAFFKEMSHSPQSGVLAIGLHGWDPSSSFPPPDEYARFSEAASFIGEDFTVVNDEDVMTVDLDDHKILVIPEVMSEVFSLPLGTDQFYSHAKYNNQGVTLQELSLLETRRCEIQRFVNQGGAVLALGAAHCSDVDPSVDPIHTPWLTYFVCSEWDSGHYDWLVAEDPPMSVDIVGNTWDSASVIFADLQPTPQMNMAGFALSSEALGPYQSGVVKFGDLSPDSLFQPWLTDDQGRAITIGKAVGGTLGESCIPVSGECAYLYSDCGNGTVDDGEECDYGEVEEGAFHCVENGAGWQCCNLQCRWEDAPEGYCGEAAWVAGGEDENGVPALFVRLEPGGWEAQTINAPFNQELKEGVVKNVNFGASPVLSSFESGFGPYWESVGVNGRFVVKYTNDLEKSDLWGQVPPKAIVPKFFGSYTITDIVQSPDPVASGQYRWVAVGCKGRLLTAHLRSNGLDPMTWEFTGDGPLWFKNNFPQDSIDTLFGNTCIRAITHNNKTGPLQRWVIVGDRGKIAVSSSLNLWFINNNSGFGNSRIHDITHNGEDMYVAVANDGKIGYSISLDAAEGTWNVKQYNSYTNFYSVAYSPYGYEGRAGLWVAVGGLKSGYARIYTSFDGIDWTSLGPIGPDIDKITSVKHNGLQGPKAQWMAVSLGGRVLTSSDGINWTVQIAMVEPLGNGEYKEYSLQTLTYKPQFCQ